MPSKNTDNPYAPPRTQCSPQPEIHEKLVLKKTKLVWKINMDNKYFTGNISLL